MELVNAIYQFDAKTGRGGAVLREAIETTITLLSPFVPHIAEELWRTLGKTESMVQTRWPEFDPAATVEEMILIVIQVNGKLRDRMSVPISLGEEDVKEAALSRDKVRGFTGGKQIKRVIVVPGKLVNVVCG
jgi:leucyl-tRNA synthetase